MGRSYTGTCLYKPIAFCLSIKSVERGLQGQKEKEREWEERGEREREKRT
jgi:predicted N-acyltransferase